MSTPNINSHTKLPIIDDLWNSTVVPEQYGGKDLYITHVFEQYKLYIEMADRISSRRNLANTFFLTLHTLLLGASAFFYEKGPQIANMRVVIVPLLGALALCYVWWRMILSYRQLNAAKYRVIGEYERVLPSSPYWAAEWKALGEGKNPKIYRSLSDVENWVPVLFGLFYVIAFFAIML